MSTTLEQPAAAPAPAGPAPRRPWPGWVPAFRATGWTLLLLWAFATVTAQFVGYSDGSASDLRQGLRSGEVTQVVLDLDTYPDEVDFGYTEGSVNHVDVQWRDGWRLRRTTLTEYPTEARAERARERVQNSQGSGPGQPEPARIVVAPVQEWLEAFEAEVVVADLPPARYSIGSLNLPAPLFTTLLGLTVATWLLVAVNAQPWRATSWAWAWLVLVVPPLGVPAYLLLGGPTGLFRPAEGHRRLTGGWALLLAWLVLAPLSAGLLGGTPV
ncbi:MAG: hypothetical protein ACI379_03425 [Nocardioides sp.]|uniref:hypothetical protein n=1 Tax=Nocardioides sp. TaxID=35761 RepID=UPI003F09DC19